MSLPVYSARSDRYWAGSGFVRLIDHATATVGCPV